MSSVTTAVATTAADDVTVTADEVAKTPRRFPLPCWTQEETLALIGAYRERWYELRRGYLRTADWDAVAAAVDTRCPGASPAKTSAQCRHKMEKLRQRYRAERQRALSLPCPDERYFSSWFFFENMEAMEKGTTPPTSVQKSENSSDGSGLKSFMDQNLLKLKLKAKNTQESSPDLGFDKSVQAKRFNSATGIPIQYSSYLGTEIADKDEEDIPQDDDFIDREMTNQPTHRLPIQVPPLKSKSKQSGRIFNASDASAGFRQQMLPPGLKIEKIGYDYNRSNPNEYFWMKFPNNSDNNISKFADPGTRSLNPNSESRSAMNGLKRGRNGLAEIVASIKVLGEDFVKMEKEKMEMAREIESMRMEMEMKRNQMLLDSQKQIVDAFLEGLFEIKKSKKVKSGVAADSSEP